MQTRLGDDLHHSHGSTSRVNDHHWATGAYARTTHAGLRMRMHVHSDPVVVHPMLPMRSHSHQQHPRPPGPALFGGVEYLDDEVDGTPGWTVHPTAAALGGECRLHSPPGEFAGTTATNGRGGRTDPTLPAV